MKVEKINFGSLTFKIELSGSCKTSASNRVFPKYTKLTILASNSNVSDNIQRMEKSSLFLKILIKINILLFWKNNSFVYIHLI